MKNVPKTLKCKLTYIPSYSEKQIIPLFAVDINTKLTMSQTRLPHCYLYFEFKLKL